MLRDRYFQTALQFGGLYVDVSNDTVIVTKPKIEILPMEDSGLVAVSGAAHFSRIAETYWGVQVYANHALPSLAPMLPMIAVAKGKAPVLESTTRYMTELFVSVTSATRPLAIDAVALVSAAERASARA